MAASSGSRAPSSPRSLVRLLVTAAVLVAVWWPARPGGTDGFPLSSYPMFGDARSPISRVDTVVGIGPDGRSVTLTPWHLGGTRRSKHALHTVQTAVHEGQARALCREVARRLAAEPRPEPVVALEVVTEVWDPLRAAEPGARPRRRRVHARCEVP